MDAPLETRQELDRHDASADDQLEDVTLRLAPIRHSPSYIISRFPFLARVRDRRACRDRRAAVGALGELGGARGAGDEVVARPEEDAPRRVGLQNSFPALARRDESRSMGQVAMMLSRGA